MPLFYSCVAQNTTVLSECSSITGNLGQIARSFLSHPSTRSQKTSFMTDEYMIFSSISSNLTFICLADQTFPQNDAFAFLSAVEESFLQRYGLVSQSLPPLSKREFNTTLHALMTSHSHATVDRITRAENDIDDLKNVLHSNVETLLNRQEKLELLVDDSNELDSIAANFSKGSRGLKRTMWWKNVLIGASIAVGIILIVFFITVLVCGGFTFKYCKVQTPKPIETEQMIVKLSEVFRPLKEEM
ncbi:putative Vesicle-associated membrane protein [Blattamonas nauphoetae]|uniref:Vesicle-associated membrane protein n=1 Tax=Blattamonas nauphoetae TaxID=2049346 RepID=A0ABQ9X168_9EUKA|nr:putative Vesicle-associated membrane protein [Blattamonas nauphoetae]